MACRESTPAVPFSRGAPIRPLGPEGSWLSRMGLYRCESGSDGRSSGTTPFTWAVRLGSASLPVRDGNFISVIPIAPGPDTLESVNLGALYEHIMSVLNPVGLACGISGFTVLEVVRRMRAGRAAPAVEYQRVRAVPAADPPPYVTPVIFSGSHVDARGAATTMGSGLGMPIVPVTYMPGAFGSEVPVGTAATA